MTSDFYTYFPETPFEKDSPRQKEVSAFLAGQCAHFIRAHEFWGGGIVIRAYHLPCADDINKELSRLDNKEKWKFAEIPAPPVEFIDVMQRLYNPPSKHAITILAPPQETSAPNAPAPEIVPYKVEEDPLKKLVGVDSIVRQFREVSGTITASRFSNTHFGTAIPDGFVNILVVGAQGVGTSTMARVFADSVLYQTIVESEKAPVFIKAVSLVGKSSGTSENALLKKMEDARGGILIIDDIHDLLDVYSYGPSTLNALNSEMGNSRNNPVVIATCRESRYDELVKTNDGLAGHFAHTFHVYAADNKTLASMFRNKIDDARLICKDKAVFDALDSLLDTARKVKKTAFSNGYEVEAIFGAMMAQKLDRQRKEVEAFKKIVARGRKIPEDRLRDYRTIRLADMPVFDRGLRSYVARSAPALPPLQPKEVVVAMRPAPESNNVLPFRKPQN